MGRRRKKKAIEQENNPYINEDGTVDTFTKAQDEAVTKAQAEEDENTQRLVDSVTKGYPKREVLESAGLAPNYKITPNGQPEITGVVQEAQSVPSEAETSVNETVGRTAGVPSIPQVKSREELDNEHVTRQIDADAEEAGKEAEQVLDEQDLGTGNEEKSEEQTAKPYDFSSQYLKEKEAYDPEKDETLQRAKSSYSDIWGLMDSLYAEAKKAKEEKRKKDEEEYRRQSISNMWRGIGEAGGALANLIGVSHLNSVPSKMDFQTGKEVDKLAAMREKRKLEHSKIEEALRTQKRALEMQKGKDNIALLNLEDQRRKQAENENAGIRKHNAAVMSSEAKANTDYYKAAVDARNDALLTQLKYQDSAVKDKESQSKVKLNESRSNYYNNGGSAAKNREKELTPYTINTSKGETTIISTHTDFNNAIKDNSWKLLDIITSEETGGIYTTYEEYKKARKASPGSVKNANVDNAAKNINEDEWLLKNAPHYRKFMDIVEVTATKGKGGEAVVKGSDGTLSDKDWLESLRVKK